MVEIARRYSFAFLAHWVTDVIGHRGTVADGARNLEIFDGVMRGVLDVWDDDEGLIVITSDHGNMEDLSHTKHTENDVPTVVIGTGKEEFAAGVKTLADITPQMAAYLFAQPHGCSAALLRNRGEAGVRSVIELSPRTGEAKHFSSILRSELYWYEGCG